jgi:hypothetical protein
MKGIQDDAIQVQKESSGPGADEFSKIGERERSGIIQTAFQ